MASKSFGCPTSFAKFVTDVKIVLPCFVVVIIVVYVVKFFVMFALVIISMDQ
jgi:hypothetical protein